MKSEQGLDVCLRLCVSVVEGHPRTETKLSPISKTSLSVFYVMRLDKFELPRSKLQAGFLGRRKESNYKTIS